jgi:hypothetical protein
MAKNASRVNTAACATANAAKYPGCAGINTAYVSAAGMSGLFGLRAGSLCKALDHCTGLPAECRLRAAVGSANITAALDLCTAEGVVGGSPVSSKWQAMSSCYVLSFIVLSCAATVFLHNTVVGYAL